MSSVFQEQYNFQFSDAFASQTLKQNSNLVQQTKSSISTRISARSSSSRRINNMPASISRADSAHAFPTTSSNSFPRQQTQQPSAFASASAYAGANGSLAQISRSASMVNHSSNINRNDNAITHRIAQDLIHLQKNKLLGGLVQNLQSSKVSQRSISSSR